MKKDIKIYSYQNLSSDIIDIISKTCIDYANAYNYFFERYCGIKNIVKTSSIVSTRKEIRNYLTHNDVFRREIKLQKKLWVYALEDATSNIRSMWSNLFNKIRSKMYRNENLDDTQRHLINYLFMDKVALEHVLNAKHPNIPKSFSEEISENKFRNTCKILKRYIRKYKPKKSKNSKKRSYVIEDKKYSYIEKDGVLYISVMTNIKRKRVEIPLKGNKIITGNIRLVLDRDRKRVIIHKCTDAKTSNIVPIKDKKVGVDKGINKLLSTSTENTYGENISTILKEKTDWERNKVKERNKHRKAYYKALKNGNLEKAQRILENNLGKLSFNRVENKFQENLKSNINHEIRVFFETEKPEVIILEDLSFTSWTKRMSSKTRYLLSSWYKGYLDKRMVYLAEYYNCCVEYVNPAYTSQTCSHCGHVDKESRKGESFKCTKCGFEMDADINAAINILNRSEDERINLYTPYYKVKEILLSEQK